MGSTQTMALLPGSTAIGTGTAVDGITTDQRGLPPRFAARYRGFPEPGIQVDASCRRNARSRRPTELHSQIRWRSSSRRITPWNRWLAEL